MDIIIVAIIVFDMGLEIRKRVDIPFSLSPVADEMTCRSRLLMICSPIVFTLPVGLRFGKPFVRQARWLDIVMRVLESFRSKFG